MADINIGRALSGLGAAFKNEMPAFMQQVRQEDAQERAQMLQNEDLAEKRKTTLFKDAMMMRSNPQMAGSILQDRLELLERFQKMGVPVDRNHTQEMMQLYQSGDMNAFTGYLDRVIDSGRAMGVIAAPVAPTAYDPGQVLIYPDGRQRTINAPEGYVSKEELTETRKLIDGNMVALNKTAGQTLENYKKLDNLTGQVRMAQAEDATPAQIQQGRRALGTILTLNARLASPGVVTDQDYQTQAGSSDLSSELFGMILGVNKNNPNMASVLAGFDPTNPLNVDVDLLLEGAKAMTKGGVESLLNIYAQNRGTARGYEDNLSETFINTRFGERGSRNLFEMAKLTFPGFNVNEYRNSPTEYFTGFQEERARSNTPPNLSIRAGSSRVYANAAEAQAAGDRGEFVIGDIITINGVNHTAQ